MDLLVNITGNASVNGTWLAAALNATNATAINTSSNTTSPYPVLPDAISPSPVVDNITIASSPPLALLPPVLDIKQVGGQCTARSPACQAGPLNWSINAHAPTPQVLNATVADNTVSDAQLYTS